MKFQRLLLPALVLALGFAACDKDDTGGTTKLNIHMTDGPGDFQEVNVDIREIRVKMAGDTANWLVFNTQAGIYNLLDYQNGLDTLIATGTVPQQVVKEVRFVLGANNSVMVDSVLYPLETPSAQQSGLKVKVDQDLAASLDSLLFDFDAALSVHQQGNGTYQLKPVIKLK